jgi:putative Ca2+/H+ antiporter (TMEM165/GDT1 family)
VGRRHFSAGLAVTTSRLFVLLGIACALAIIVFRAQSLGLERAHLIQQRQAQAVTLAQFASTYSARLYDQSSRIGSEVGDYIKRTNPSPETLRAY